MIDPEKQKQIIAQAKAAGIPVPALSRLDPETWMVVLEEQLAMLADALVARAPTPTTKVIDPDGPEMIA